LEETVQAAAPSLPELFLEVARRISAVVCDPATVGAALREKSVLEADSEEGLLHSWAVHLLDLAAHQQLLFADFKIRLSTSPEGRWTLQAELLGELIDPMRHAVRGPWRCPKASLRPQPDGSTVADLELEKI
jgi:SHS2 domain-containing protein